jgi:subtilisin family serine protease
LGFTTDAYSGSTHDIEAFDGTLANPENDWGRGTYSTTSVDDVNANYAGEGPDLTGRIQAEGERLLEHLDDIGAEQFIEDFGLTGTVKPSDRYDKIVGPVARRGLVGEASEGVVYPLKINTKNYASVGGENPTRLTQPDFYEQAKGEGDIVRADFDDADDYEDALRERSYEIADEDSEALYPRIADALRGSDLYKSEDDVDRILQVLGDDIADGDVSIADIDDAIRRNAQDLYDDNGEMISAGEISAQVVKELGFDGVVDKTINQKFGAGRRYGGGMEGIDDDTAHIVTFPDKEATIRSKFAKFDPKNIKSKDILAGALPFTLLEDEEGNGMSELSNALRSR